MTAPTRPLPVRILADDTDAQVLGYLHGMLADPGLLGWALVLLAALPAK